MLKHLIQYFFTSEKSILNERPAYMSELAAVAPKLHSALFKFSWVTVFVLIPLFALAPGVVSTTSASLTEVISAYAICTLALATTLGCFVLLEVDTLKPLKLTPTGCERALHLIGSSKRAAGHRDTVINRGEELLVFDLRAMERLAAQELELDARDALERDWAGADGQAFARDYRRQYAKTRRVSRAITSFAAIAVTALFVACSENPLYWPLYGAAAFLGFLAGALLSMPYESYAESKLEKIAPVWEGPARRRSWLKTLSSIEEAQGLNGPGWSYLSGVRASGKPLTEADVAKAASLDQAAKRDLLCKQVHAVGPSPEAT